MGKNSVHRLESLGIIVGPIMALVFFLIEPGGLIFNSAESGDAVGVIEAMASNQTITHISALFVPLGLILMVYGLAGINRAIQEESMAAAWTRLGILCITVGATGWILTAGLSHVLAETDPDAIQSAVPVYKTDSGIAIISTMAVATGFLTFNLGLSVIYPPGRRRIGALVIAAVSVVCLVALIIGHTFPNPDMITVSRICYIPWVMWTTFIGIRFYKGIGFTDYYGAVT